MTEESENKKVSIIKSSSQFGLTTLISRLTGFLRDVLFANYFGAGANTDAFFVAFKIPNFFRRLFAEGAFTQSFVPVLQEYKLTKPEMLYEFIQFIFGNLFFVLLVITLLGMYFSEELIYLFAPGFINDPTKLTLASEMLYITFPYLLFISLTAMCSGIFNSYNRFILSGITPVFLNLSLIVFTIFSTTLFVIPIVSLSYGVLVAGVVQLTIQLPLMYKLGFLKIPKINFSNKGSVKVIKLMGPAIIGTAAVQVNLLIDTIVASLLITGSISWLYFSDRLIELPLAIFGIAISIVMLPVLSEYFQKSRMDDYSETLEKSTKLSLLIAIPSMAGLIILSAPIVSSLFMYGNFQSYDARMTSLSLITYSLGLPAFIFMKILVTAFHSRHDMKTPVIYSLFGILLNIIANLTVVFIYIRHPFEGAHAFIALATSLSAWAQVILMSLRLKKINIIENNIFFNMVSLKIILSAIAMGLVIYLSFDVSTFGDDLSPYKRIGSLLAYILTGAIVYYVFLRLFGVRLSKFKI